MTSSYHPQSNGGSEKFNKTLMEALPSYVSARQDDWDTYLVYIEFAYNNSVEHEVIAQSPHAPWDLFNTTESNELHRGIFVFVMLLLVNLIRTSWGMLCSFRPKI